MAPIAAAPSAFVAVEPPGPVEAAAPPEAPPTEPTPESAPDLAPAPDVNDLLSAAREAREAGRPAEARATLETAADAFPEAASVRHDLARLAEAGGDWPEAERRWREFAALGPTVWWAVSHVIHALRQQGRTADAEALLTDSLDRFPDEVQLLIDHARMAEMRRDWPEAGTRWAAVTERFPDRWEGLAGQGRALREQGLFDDARALLLLAVERFPAAAGPLHELARVAERERDWAAAETCWREAVALDPAPWWGFTSLANALREQGRMAEAGTVLVEQFERLGHERFLFVEYARLAERSADWPQALRRWEDVTRRFPDFWDGYGGQARALRQLGNVDAARQILTDAAQRFPALSMPLHDLARLAETERNWAAAEKWWRAFIAVDSGPWWGYAGLSTALREQGRAPEADAVVAGQLERLAHEPGIHIEYARTADRSADWPAAEARYAAVRQRFPNLWDGYAGEARALRQQGANAVARAVLTEAADRFPTMPNPAHDLARLAEMERDWPAAEAAWRQYIRLDPGPWFAYSGLAVALREQGRTEAAAAVLAEQLERLAEEPAMFIEYARLAERDRDWPEAARRWDLMVSRFPNRWDAYGGQARSLAEMGQLDEAAAVLKTAAEHFPGNPRPPHELARLATRRRDWPETERLSRESLALALDDGYWPAISTLARALRELDRKDEAETVLLAALSRHPGELTLFADYARLAEFRRDWPTALDRWTEVRERFPDSWVGPVGYAAALRHMDRPDEARDALEQTVARLPDQVVPLQELARLAEYQRDWQQAEHGWRQMIDRFPQFPAGPAGLAAALRMQDRIPEAQAVLDAAMGQMPYSHELLEQSGLIFVAQQDWTRALARFETGSQQFPTLDLFRRRIQEVESKMAEHDAAQQEDSDREVAEERY